MTKLFVLCLLLALIAATLAVVFVVLTGKLADRRERKQMTKKDPQHLANVDDAAWLYANGASLSDIKLAQAQRRLLE